MRDPPGPAAAVPWRRADDTMSSALEVADGAKRKRSGGGFVESLGREILVQARALDKASGVKFGVLNSDSRVIPEISPTGSPRSNRARVTRFT